MAAKSTDDLNDLVNCFDLLSDKTRMQIVLILAKGPSKVGDLCAQLAAVADPMVSHHLGVLRMNRLIVGKRQGKNVVYTLADHAKGAGGKLKVTLPPYSVTIDAK